MINGAIYRHIKRGSYYVLLTREAVSQNKDEKHDNVAYCVYQSLKDSSVWVRPRTEFFDGRFEQITSYGGKL